MNSAFGNAGAAVMRQCGRFRSLRGGFAATRAPPATTATPLAGDFPSRCFGQQRANRSGCHRGERTCRGSRNISGRNGDRRARLHGACSYICAEVQCNKVELVSEGALALPVTFWPATCLWGSTPAAASSTSANTSRRGCDERSEPMLLTQFSARGCCFLARECHFRATLC